MKSDPKDLIDCLRQRHEAQRILAGRLVLTSSMLTFCFFVCAGILVETLPHHADEIGPLLVLTFLAANLIGVDWNRRNSGPALALRGLDRRLKHPSRYAGKDF